MGRLIIQSITYSESATGVRYSAASLGLISTNGGGANFFPGNSAGTGTNAGARLTGFIAKWLSGVERFDLYEVQPRCKQEDLAKK
jgi:hypothetical protein